MTAARIPAAEWQAAKGRQTTADRDKLAAWLRIDGSAKGAFYATLPFVRLETDDGPALAATFEPPLVFFHWPSVINYTSIKGEDGVYRPSEGKSLPDELPDHIWNRIGFGGQHSDVLLCDRNQIHRVRGNMLVLPDDCSGPVTVYFCSKEFARAWAQNRLLFVERRRVALEQYQVDLCEPLDGGLPGALLIGDASRVQWPRGVDFQAPDEPTAKVINIAIWKAAQLSRATVAQTLKAVG